MKKKKILIAPLDWGLGHATRCIPIIRELLSQDAEVIIAADRRPHDLLKREFPDLELIRLPGFDVQYPDDGKTARWMMRQIPRLISATFHEHRTLRKLITDLELDAVISDNRFGMFSHRIPGVYMTHQIWIRMPKGFGWAARAVSFLHKAVIAQYTRCWIPDYAGPINLSGDLSHNRLLPKNASYIGPLSRFKIFSGVTKEFDVLVVLSGPEPQRTILENIIMEQLKHAEYRALVVRGIPEKNQRMKLSDSISVVSSLESEALNRAMLASEVVVSRPGYSTLMDLAALGTKAILVPTPGQTEQEYLAALLEKTKKFHIQYQETFDLRKGLRESNNYPGYAGTPFEESSLHETVAQFLSRIHSRVLNS